MYTTDVTGRYLLKQKGLTLIELVMFIVIVGVGVAGILTVMNVVTRNSADPMIRKQATAIAESLMEEIQLQAFTFCDPDDANAGEATAATSAQCPKAGGSGGVEDLGPETDGSGTETRYALPHFDNVNDYLGFTMTVGGGGIFDLTNTPIVGLEGYSATVAVAPAGNTFNGIAGYVNPANDAAMQITVTVTAPDNSTVTLTGYRFRYAPKL